VALTKAELRIYGLAAGFFTAAAGLGAFAAVLHVGTMLLAFVAAGFANLGALAQQVRGVFGVPGYQAGRQRADVSAVAVQADAADHHVDVILLQTGRSTVLAGGNTSIEGVEQTLILLRHNKEIK
jgi:hypothetical protein